MNRKEDAMNRSRQLLGIVIIFFWASEYAHVPYFTPYLNLLGFGASTIGIMVGTYGMTQMIIRIPLGIMTDLTGSYRRVVIMGAAFTTISSFGLMFAKSMWFIVFCRFLAGVAASTWLAFSVLYSAYYDASEGVTAMTNINVYNNAGKLLAFVFGTLVATWGGYRYPLVVSFLTGVIAVILALQLKEIPIKKEPIRISGMIACFKNPSVLIPAGFAIILQMVLQGTTFSFTSSVAESLGASRLQIGINTSLFTVIQVLAGGWIGRHIIKKIGDTFSVAVGFCCICASCIFTAFAPSIYVLYLAQCLGGIGNIMLMSLLMALAIRTVPASSKSTAMGLFQALYGIGMTMGPVLIGRIAAATNYVYGYVCFGGISILCALLAFVLIPRVGKAVAASS